MNSKTLARLTLPRCGHRRILPAKNSLAIAEARQLENAFRARLAELELGADAAEPHFELMPKPTWSLEQKGSESTEGPNTERIERSGDTHPELRRARDKDI